MGNNFISGTASSSHQFDVSLKSTDELYYRKFGLLEDETNSLGKIHRSSNNHSLSSVFVEIMGNNYYDPAENDLCAHETVIGSGICFIIWSEGQSGECQSEYYWPPINFGPDSKRSMRDYFLVSNEHILSDQIYHSSRPYHYTTSYNFYVPIISSRLLDDSNNLKNNTSDYKIFIAKVNIPMHELTGDNFRSNPENDISALNMTVVFEAINAHLTMNNLNYMRPCYYAYDIIHKDLYYENESIKKAVVKSKSFQDASGYTSEKSINDTFLVGEHHGNADCFLSSTIGCPVTSHRILSNNEEYLIAIVSEEESDDHNMTADSLGLVLKTKKIHDLLNISDQSNADDGGE